MVAIFLANGCPGIAFHPSLSTNIADNLARLNPYYTLSFGLRGSTEESTTAHMQQVLF